MLQKRDTVAKKRHCCEKETVLQKRDSVAKLQQECCYFATIVLLFRNKKRCEKETML
jgi:hypothetical protein